jgi:mercuric ion transport protein
MTNDTFIKTGIVGAVIAAVCCATPILVILLGVVGLSAFTSSIDYVVLPVLAFCIGLIALGVYNRRQNASTATGNRNKTTTGI